VTVKVTNNAVVAGVGSVTVQGAASAPTVTALQHSGCSNSGTGVLGTSGTALVGCPTTTAGAAGVLTIMGTNFYGTVGATGCSSTPVVSDNTFTKLTCPYQLLAVGAGAIAVKATTNAVASPGIGSVTVQ